MIRDAVSEPSDTSEMSLEEESRRRRQRLFALVRARLHWMILVGLVFGGLGAAYGYLSVRPLYASSGQYEINPFQRTSIFRDGEIQPMWREWLTTNLQLLRDRDVLQRAMASDAWKRAVAETGIGMSLGEFAKGVRSDMHRKALLVDLIFEAPHPKLAQAGVNSVMTEFKRAFDEKEAEGPAQRYSLLNTQLQNANAEKTRFERLRREMIGNDLGSAILKPQIEFLSQNLGKLQSEKEMIERQLNTMQAGGQDLRGLNQDELAAIDVELARQLQLKREIEMLIENNKRRGLSDNHYVQRSLRADLDGADLQIAQRVAQLRMGTIAANGTLMSMQQLQVQKEQVDRQLAQAEERFTYMAKKFKDAQEIESRIEESQAEITRINNQLEAIEVQGLLGGKLTLRSTGAEPTSPSNETEPLKKAVIFGAMGSFFGAGVIFLIGLLDPRMRRIEDAEMDLPDGRLLGILPTLPADLHDPEQAVLVAHSVHHVRTLLQIGRDHSGNAFSITSPAAGSGKTSLTIALGLSFASAGSKTLLIDADIVGGGLTRRMGFVVHPRLGQVLRQMGLVTEPQIQDALRVAQASGAKIGEAIVDLGYATRPDIDEALARQQETSVGLLEAAGDYRFEECVAPTGIKNLYMLPLGEALPQQAGALSPAALRRLVAQARNQFDVVILDTGPLLGSLEASMAAGEVDSTILIVSRGDAKPAVQRCMTHLKAVRGRLAGVVFNHALQADIARSTYASVTVSQGRHPANTARVTDIDQDTSARFGPLATAVACYAAGGTSIRARAGARPTNDGLAYDDAEARRQALASAATAADGAPRNSNGKNGRNGH